MGKLILDALKNGVPEGDNYLSAGQVGKLCNISRTTAKKYLELLIVHGEVLSNYANSKNGFTVKLYRTKTELEKDIDAIPF